ncbi:MAG: NADH-ubiquinone oxidoreductase-F iron-sulfur binding region domain-containing protein [bacterium]|nr:NADH-ubiquinone oxidoreductase-F iron-sulfur binding region domain-containing protein [bacterium]
MKRLNQVLLHEKNRIGADFEQWVEIGGAEALKLALADPATVIEKIKDAGLRGLGGSGFPAHIKWKFLADKVTDGDKYLICNGNEDEPGTFKDRVLLEETPHQLIEGALIAAVATGINKVVFYINPDLEAAHKAMGEALRQWQESEVYRLLDKQMNGRFEMWIHRTSGHYIGGEETAAIESVEGKFPFPRGKPPYPAESGVFGCPTLINNMETLSNVSHIIQNGADWFKNLGIGDATGTKIYSLSGDVLNPGVYELPMGVPLEELIFTYGGGMLQGKKFKAVFTGGPSNTLLTREDLDVALDFDSVKERRSALGTGAMIVVSEGTGIVKRVAEYVNFFAHSSCGQCPPCKSGTFYMSMLLDKIDTGRGRRGDLDALVNLTEILPGGGRCHLLDGAVKVVESSLYHFKDEFEKPLRD